MRKATLVIIAIIYLASIAIVSFFGMSIKVYNLYVPVESIECINVSEEEVIVDTRYSPVVIKTQFTTPANVNTLTGTMIQILWRVLPDNATSKNVTFEYDKNNTAVSFYKDANGNETGLVLFSAVAMVNVKIMSTDGRRVYDEVLLWAHP